jgi:hypothetical protein
MLSVIRLPLEDQGCHDTLPRPHTQSTRGPAYVETGRGDLRERSSMSVAVPTLRSEGIAVPYWRHHATAILESLPRVPISRSIVFVGHSGAGPCLPAARSRMLHPVKGYIFVDARLPGRDGASRLDLSREAAERFRLRVNEGLLPIWTELVGITREVLHDLIPDPVLQQRFVTELRPTPLAVYEEPLPVPPGWPDAPCAYLKFSPAYAPAAARARQLGWPCLELSGGHFQMLVQPTAVADALIELVRIMGLLTA